MSEPKKETVRIVLPPRREGQPLASTPRETAMINLPPKPVPAASGDAAAPAPPSMPAPQPPSGLQPPSAPGIPKPPSFPGAAPKPPGMPPSAPSAPGVPKPASVPSAPPGIGKVPSNPTVALKTPPPPTGPTPIAVKPEAKKETAKIGSGIAVKPQATVRLQPRPQPMAAASSSFKIQSAEIIPSEETTEEEIPMNLSIAALVTALIALALQVWMLVP